MSEHLYSYLDDLLRLQSEAAERHNHNGVLGEVREEFVIQVLGGRIDDIKLHKGEVVADGNDMGQHDVIIRRRGTINPEHGGQVRISASDCAGVIEVKSNAKATEIRDFDDKSRQIKSDNANAICGMVCYKLQNKKETILKRMGFHFDRDIEGFIETEDTELTYQHIDFILCLDEEYEEASGYEYSKSFFIRKDISGKYELFLEPPYMQYFLMQVNSTVNAEAAA